MFCNKCGAVVPDDSIFCNFCGTEVPASLRQPSKKTKGQSESNAQPTNKKPIKPVVVKPEATEKPHPVAAQPPEAPAAQNSLPSSQDDGEKTKTKKTVLIISIAASVVLIGIILTGVLLLKQPDNDRMEASNDATFEVSREDSDTTVQQSNDASLEVSREDTDTTVQQFPTPNQMTSEEEQQGQYAASSKEEIAYDLYLQTDKNHIVDGETIGRINGISHRNGSDVVSFSRITSWRSSRVKISGLRFREKFDSH